MQTLDHADYLGSSYWSGPFTWSDQVIDIAHGRAMIHVTDDGADIADASVYLFSDTGSYLGVSGETDGDGHVSFTLPAKAYRFRVDHNGARYWSEATDIIAHEETEIGLQLEELALHEKNDPLLCRFDGTPPAYAPEPVLLACIGTLTGLLSQSIVARIPEEEVYYYYINDHLGTPVKLIDEDNQVVWAADYVPFGEANITVETIKNDFRLPGQVYDDETGLHYNWHRYYKPEIGRYVTADPIGLAGGINLYGYCLSDPVNLWDPYGLFNFTYSAGGHLPTGPWPVAVGGTASSELVRPFDASGKLEGRRVAPEATAGVWADIGVSAGVGDLSGTGNQAGAIIAIGFGRYSGFQATLRREFDPNRAWYDPLKYFDGFSVGLGLGLGLPVNITAPLTDKKRCAK